MRLVSTIKGIFLYRVQHMDHGIPLCGGESYGRRQSRQAGCVLDANSTRSKVRSEAIGFLVAAEHEALKVPAGRESSPGGDASRHLRSEPVSARQYVPLDEFH